MTQRHKEGIRSRMLAKNKKRVGSQGQRHENRSVEEKVFERSMVGGERKLQCRGRTRGNQFLSGWLILRW